MKGERERERGGECVRERERERERDGEEVKRRNMKKKTLGDNELLYMYKCHSMYTHVFMLLI